MIPHRPLSRLRRFSATAAGLFGPSASGGGGTTGWFFMGSAVDLDFQNNVGAINSYQTGTATSQLTLTRTTSGYAQSLSTGLWTSFASGQFRQTDKGLLIEEARTNNLLWCRDMTNAAWVKGATMTAALTQTGIDGTGNSASLLTGGAVAGTNTVLQTITLGSAADTYSVFLKRVTGSGTVNISADGSTWTPVTLTTSYQQFQVQQTLANPVCGIQIITNGDQVAADFSQLETGAFATSPILTSTVAVTRNADAITPAAAIVNVAGSAVSCSIFAQSIGLTNSTKATLIGITGGIGSLIADDSNTLLSNVNAAVATANTASWATASVKSFYASDGAGVAVVLSGGTPATTGTADRSTANTNSAAIRIGQGMNATTFMDGYLQRLTLWNDRLSNAFGQLITT